LQGTKLAAETKGLLGVKCHILKLKVSLAERKLLMQILNFADI